MDDGKLQMTVQYYRVSLSRWRRISDVLCKDRYSLTFCEVRQYMLANFDSRLSKIRSRQSLRHHHIENCNSIHCDIVEGVLRRNRGSHKDESDNDDDFIRNMRSFVANQSSQREILLGCISNSTVQQTLFAR